MPEVQALLVCAQRLKVRIGIRGGVVRNFLLGLQLKDGVPTNLVDLVDPFSDIDCVLDNEFDWPMMASAPKTGAMHPISLLVTADDTPPVLRHKPVATAESLHPMKIVAHVEDPSGVKWVHLQYRGMSQHQDFQTLEILPTGRPEEYEAVIPGDEIDPHFDLMYFFEAMENAGNGKIYPNK
jgi:hypothetical protein